MTNRLVIVVGVALAGLAALAAVVPETFGYLSPVINALLVPLVGFAIWRLQKAEETPRGMSMVGEP